MADSVKADFRVLFEKAPGLLFVVDPQFFILAVTDNYLRATFTRREDIVGQHLFDVFPDNIEDPQSDAMRKLRSSLERALRERVVDAMAVQQYNVRRPDGSMEERFWSAVNTPVLGKSGEVEYIIHAAKDVTTYVQQQRMAEAESAPSHLDTKRYILTRSEEVAATNQQLKLANEELAMRTAELHDTLQTMQTFTYSIAHDLRAPLRALVSFSTVVLEEYANKLDESGKDCLYRIKDAARRMDMLVSDLLAYGQLTHVDVTAVPISLESTINKILKDMSSEIGARKAEIHIQQPLPTVVANPMLLNQVLVNLIDNALKFVPVDKTPRIVIHAEPVENRLRLCITDNGIGIAPEYCSRIFELFARLHKPTEYTGTGIGLALVKKAMERMMGKVGVESKPGEGSRFWLEFRGGR